MKKRTLALLLCIALVTLVAVNDTLAAEVVGAFNKLTDLLGDVLGNPSADPAALDVQIVSSTDGVLTPAHYADAFAWEKVTPVQKTTCVQNVQSEAAFVRICIAVKQAECLKFRLAEVPEGYAVAQEKTITIGGKAFTLYTFDYQQKLAQNSSTPVITMDFALTKETTNEHLAALGTDFVQVRSFAIQASAFAKLDEAGNQIAKDDTTTQPMKPEIALQHALGDMESFNPFN